MSWDLYAFKEDGTDGAVLMVADAFPIANYTSNTTKILRLAFNNIFGIQCLHNKPAHIAVLMVADAFKYLVDPANRENLLALQPVSGWGSLEGVTSVMASIAVDLTAFDAHVVKVYS